MKGKTILIIEDDRLVAKSLESLLSRRQVKVMIASNGELAKSLARQHEFDLIISDIRMPGEIGTTVVKEVNKIQSAPRPFIFITGYADEEYLKEAERMGCYAFLLKPFDMEDLVKKLEEALQLSLKSEEIPLVEGLPPPSRTKKFFYSALGSQWNPEKEIDWRSDIALDDSLKDAMAYVLSPIIMGEHSAFYGLPQRIMSFNDYEVKQYLAAQMVDETRHAEAFDLYIAKINGAVNLKKGFRNLSTLKFFNRLKKLQDDDEWITGLYLTEVLAHHLLKTYSEKAPCALTKHLFSMILADEARHISFSNAYLVEIVQKASREDLVRMNKLAEFALELTKNMLFDYSIPYKAFDLDPGELFGQISREVGIRFNQHILQKVS